MYYEQLAQPRENLPVGIIEGDLVGKYVSVVGASVGVVVGVDFPDFPDFPLQTSSRDRQRVSI